MNTDPWAVLIETLVGTERQTPQRWTARRVHRMSDGAWPNVRPPRAPRRTQPLDAMGKLALARRFQAAPQLRCTCDECAPAAN